MSIAPVEASEDEAAILLPGIAEDVSDSMYWLCAPD